MEWQSNWLVLNCHPYTWSSLLCVNHGWCCSCVKDCVCESTSWELSTSLYGHSKVPECDTKCLRHEIPWKLLKPPSVVRIMINTPNQNTKKIVKLKKRLRIILYILRNLWVVLYIGLPGCTALFVSSQDGWKANVCK